MSEKENNPDCEFALVLAKLSVVISLAFMIIWGFYMSSVKSEFDEMKKKIDKIEEKVEFKMYVDKYMEKQKNE